MEGEWQAYLAAGAFRDISDASSSLPQVGGIMLPALQRAQIIGAPDHPAVTMTQPVDAALRGALSQIGLAPVSITYLHPDSGIAPVVVAKISDANAFAAEESAPWNQVFGDLNSYEGVYLEIDDAQGPIEIMTYASRAGHGTSWFRPGSGTAPAPGLHTQ